MLGRFVIVGTLLVTAVPAGCVPAFTLGTIAEEVQARRTQERGRHPNAGRETAIIAAIGFALSAGLLWVFRWQLRRSRSDEVDYPMGLSSETYRLLLWIALLLGFACGLGMTFPGLT